MENDTRYGYIHFTKLPIARMTGVYACEDNATNSRLGIVQWNGAWRKYCFYPQGGTIFDSICLNAVQDFLDKCNAEWQKKRKEARNVKRDGK